MKMQSIHDRISYLVIKYFNDNNSSFAKSIDTSEANVRNYRKNITPKLEIIKTIAKNLEINYEWLIDGEGQERKGEQTYETENENELLKEISLLKSKIIELYENRNTTTPPPESTAEKPVPH